MSFPGFLFRIPGNLVSLLLFEGIPLIGPFVHLCLERGFMFVQRAEQELGQPSLRRFFSSDVEGDGRFWSPTRVELHRERGLTVLLAA